MASALLVSRNEPYWGEQKVYMRKNPNSNPNPNPTPRIFASANPNPSRGSIFDALSTVRDTDEPPPSTVAISDDSSSLNPRNPPPGRYVTYDISSYTRKDLRELKRRLVLELEQVRSVIGRVEARSVGYRNSGVYGGGREGSSVASFAGSVTRRKLVRGMMKRCGQILSKLMKQKGAVWFNTPVDVAGMGLHDYHLIIKAPMDLGTVRSKLSKGLYAAPSEFAADIRLTFENALVYNPQGHEVHRLAEQLLRHFEGMFGPPYGKFEKQLLAIAREEEQRANWALSAASRAPPHVVPLIASPSPPPPPLQTPVQSRSAPPPPPPVETPPQPQLQAYSNVQVKQQGRRLPKPKARDPDKRAMTTEEKEKLSAAVDNLPEDRSSHVLHIIKKRNVGVLVDGDVVEIDFEVMDNETLWELDRFVVNWEKAVKKKKMDESSAAANVIAVPSTPGAAALISVSCEAGDKSPIVEETPELLVGKKGKKGGEPVDEDVDIGDDMPVASYPPIEIEKDAGHESSSSSSGSDSSSSSDSDSGSSSGSDSDSDDGEDAEPKL